MVAKWMTSAVIRAYKGILICDCIPSGFPSMWKSWWQRCSKGFEECPDASIPLTIGAYGEIHEWLEHCPLKKIHLIKVWRRFVQWCHTWWVLVFNSGNLFLFNVGCPIIKFYIHIYIPPVTWTYTIYWCKIWCPSLINSCGQTGWTQLFNISTMNWKCDRHSCAPAKGEPGLQKCLG